MENWEFALRLCSKAYGVREPEDKGMVEKSGTRFFYIYIYISGDEKKRLPWERRVLIVFLKNIWIFIFFLGVFFS